MNSEELNSAWKQIIDKVLSFEILDNSQAVAILSRVQAQAMSGDFIMLTADNDFIRNWVDQNYKEAISRALKEIYGNQFSIAIEVDPTQKTPVEPLNSSQANNSGTQEISSTTEIEKPEVDETSYEIEFTSIENLEDSEDPSSSAGMPNSSATFETFVVGPSNQMAFSMALKVAEEPGNILNPLFIYGRSGLGKTHLLRGIQNHIAKETPHLSTVYVNSNEFLNSYVEASYSHSKDKTSFRDFKNKYQEADVLLIDDVQFLQGKEETLNMVFEIFNFMIDQGKQVVLSADRAPKNITMDDRYQSRFNSGGTWDIQPPEVETKIGIIRGFINEYYSISDAERVQIPEEIERYIAEISSSNMRELKSAVIKVLMHLTINPGAELSIKDVTALLENHFSGGAMKKLSITDIQKQVELYFDISHTDLVGAKRNKNIMHARHIAIFLSRDILGAPYEFIGENFGNRDHTTMMSSDRKIKSEINTDRLLAEEIENIRRKIKEL